MKIVKDFLRFEWDSGNKDKNFIKHRVSNEECEEVFFDPHKRLVKSVFHSGKEERHILIGCTKKQRLLYIVFTKRKKKIRVISARSLNRKERGLYEEKT